MASMHDNSSVEQNVDNGIQSDSNAIEILGSGEFPLSDHMSPMPEQLAEQGGSWPHAGGSHITNLEAPHSPFVPLNRSFEMPSVKFRAPILQNTSSSSVSLSAGQPYESSSFIPWSNEITGIEHGGESSRKPWHCSVCKAAGRDGRNCPGKTNRKKCIFQVMNCK